MGGYQPTGKPTGPARQDINWELFEELCHIHCTQKEIANILKVDPDTLRTRCLDYFGKEYSVVYEMFTDKGKSSLRRQQFKTAMEGSNTMLVWLGRNWLDQTDRPPEDTNQKLEQSVDRLTNAIERNNAQLDSKNQS